MSEAPGPGSSAAARRRRETPTSTYRLQLRPPAPDGSHPGLTFDDAADVVPYLADLGVSHVYCSPVLASAAGSAHGYDVRDPSRLDDELGGESGWRRLVDAAHAAGLRVVVDVVPNHVTVAAPQSATPLWWALLRDGPGSDAAAAFDVAWEQQERATGRPRVLVPVLGAPLGEVLQAGDLHVDDDAELGVVVRYFEHVLPVAPGTEHLRDDVVALLEAQHWRLAWWRVAADEPGYRRFFDVTDLAGVRVEDPSVFDATQSRVVELVRSGDVDGLRVDHPDGLADPEGYLEALAEATDGAWVVVEKILEGDEPLPTSWPTAGTTGYDTLNRLTRLLADPSGRDPLHALYAQVTTRPDDFAEVEHDAVDAVLDRVLVAEVERLADVALTATRDDPAGRDCTRHGLREALVALLASMDVYRAYVRPGVHARGDDGPDGAAGGDRAAGSPVPEQSRERLGAVVTRARGRAPRRDVELDVLHRLLLDPGPYPEQTADARRELVVRFQQTCGPVRAKGVEDTAFYRWTLSPAHAEVGADPTHWSLDVDAWHAAQAERQRTWPTGMTTLSTHDTKRGEQVRARLLTLVEQPDAWGGAVTRWLGRHEHLRTDVAGRGRGPRARDGVGRPAPDRADALLLHAVLVGAHPLGVDRALAYLEKATREAKLRTAWVDGDPAYDEARDAYVRGVLEDQGFRDELDRFVREHVLVPGRVTALAQKVLQLAAPGVPDVYQGTEVERLELVDPDNRRPVPFDALAERLRRSSSEDVSGYEVETWPDLADDDAFDDVLQSAVAAVLRLRRERPQCWASDASYSGLAVEGPVAAHVVASAVTAADGSCAVVAAVRLPARLRAREDLDEALAATVVRLPEGRRWQQHLGSDEPDGDLLPATALGATGVALLSAGR